MDHHQHRAADIIIEAAIRRHLLIVTMAPTVVEADRMSTARLYLTGTIGIAPPGRVTMQREANLHQSGEAVVDIMGVIDVDLATIAPVDLRAMIGVLRPLQNKILCQNRLRILSRKIMLTER